MYKKNKQNKTKTTDKTKISKPNTFLNKNVYTEDLHIPSLNRPNTQSPKLDNNLLQKSVGENSTKQQNIVIVNKHEYNFYLLEKFKF
jgi:hypothetical protein